MSKDANLEKDLLKGLEMRELHDIEKFTSHVLNRFTKSLNSSSIIDLFSSMARAPGL